MRKTSLALQKLKAVVHIVKYFSHCLKMGMPRKAVLNQITSLKYQRSPKVCLEEIIQD